MPDTPFAVKEADAASTNPLLMAHQPAMDLLFLKGLRVFLVLGAQVATLPARSATLPIALAIEPVAHPAAVLLIAGCNRVPTAKSLPCLQCQGCRLMHLLMTYTH